MVEDEAVCADVLNLREVVARDDDGALTALARDDLADLLGVERVEPRGGLVEEDDLRVPDEGLRDACALRHAVRELVSFFPAASARPTRSSASIAARSAASGATPERSA